MKNIIFFLLTVLLFSSCASMKQASRKILPKSVGNHIYFGMPVKEFEQKSNTEKLTMVDSSSFRIIYFEKMNDEKLEGITYYFDKDGEQPLYETILVYKNTEDRDAVAKELFGPPNFEDEEWRITRPKSFNVKAWPYKKKLVIVAMIPQTEWYEENWK